MITIGKLILMLCKLIITLGKLVGSFFEKMILVFYLANLMIDNRSEFLDIGRKSLRIKHCR